LGFSIKSYLGSNPTLFNASKNSNLIFKITPDILPDKIAEVNSFSTYTERFQWLINQGYNLEFVKINGDIFSANLELIDCCMPKILSEIVLCKTFHGKNKLSDITEYLTQNNPCNFKININPNFYEYKIKRLLVDAALGMKAGQLWTGNFNANGGYIAVKQNGELLCYHIYNWNDFQNYLLNHTKIDYPDSSINRADFGRILLSEDVGETSGTYIKINFQIRFS
jgi:type II restriction enzyme